ncbi:conjugative transposon protein TraJ [Mucilaginibacter ginsenosidivorans]|uniref:Conjugative transposon protein TraJ n=1 Tax=Mucilaginibacter ginsenosidivorans TaxID=398053 RepID=A0A5B8UVU0_9SPHI|nr:conjugative transposon protein TraJ [Mucilaginibacter ginsenosidivorans]QEC62451.1 conjugative transposon protein TraJ [Mucilaginibacter ginsenosidivorans]
MESLTGLQATLEQVYNQMLPLCGSLIGAAQGIAGFAALWYIAARVWRQIAAAEPIDFYPLLRPFALGLAIMLFPGVIAVMNGVLQPVVAATNNMVQDSNAAIATLLQQKTLAEQKTPAYQMFVGTDGEGDRDKWYKYTHPDDPTDSHEGMIGSVGNDIKFAMAKASYNFRNSIKEWMSEILEVLYEAAALCINTIRTFQLIVLAILGPLVFGIAVFDGFQHTLTVWMARYVNVFLWLPVANIFGSIIGKVQQNMLQLDIAQIQSTGDTFFSSTDTAYLIFLLIGIVGYFTVPTTANYIVHAGGGNSLLQKINSLVSSSTRTVVSAGGGFAADAFGNQRENVTQSYAVNSESEGYFKDKLKN